MCLGTLLHVFEGFWCVRVFEGFLLCVFADYVYMCLRTMFACVWVILVCVWGLVKIYISLWVIHLNLLFHCLFTCFIMGY